MTNGLEPIGNALRSLTDFLTTAEPFACGVLFLGLVFVISGTSKLRRPDLAGFAISDFGFPRFGGRSGGLGLGSVEVAVALGLGFVSLAGGTGARILLLALTSMLLWFFAALIARALHGEEQFACHCFGTSDKPISRFTLIRTVALAVFSSAWLVAATSSMSSPSIGVWWLEIVVAAAALGTFSLLANLRGMPGEI